MATEIKSTTVDVAGKRTQLTVGGSGPPLLYLHSAGGETDWTPFHERLAAQFTVYLPAHPGFADSAGLNQVKDVHDLARHYEELLDVLELQCVPMVGFSLGGWLGVELAISRPARVQRLVLVNAAGLHVDGAPMGELFVSDLEQLKQVIFYDPNDPVVNVAMPTSLDDPRIPHWIRARKATKKIAGDPYLHDPNLAAQLDQVQCPTLVIWGREDRLIPLAHGEYFAQHIPAATLKIFEQSGHMLPHERPDEFAAEVLRFLDA
jgi:pimeloyl-ACP methyl ester carboxylesterase